jgi:molybdopterin synthase catalytic subunit
VLVACASPHRADALAACAFLIDRLKTDAPFWKRESFADGREVWVEARISDDVAAARWG